MPAGHCPTCVARWGHGENSSERTGNRGARRRLVFERRAHQGTVRTSVEARPDAELIELDATSADQYAFDEAVSPSLLSDVAVVKLVNLQNADEKLAEALVTYTKQAPRIRTAPAW